MDRAWIVAVVIPAIGCAGGEPRELDATPAPKVVEPASGDTATQPEEPVAATKAEPEPPETDLELTLMATLAAPDPAASSATIRNDATGVILSYSVGDAVLEGAVLAAVEHSWVELRRDDRVEALHLPSATIVLRDHDRYYPDLAEDDTVESITRSVALPPGPGYVIKRPSRAFGTAKMIRMLQKGLRRYLKLAPGGPRVNIGDISKKDGGPLPPHVSHRDGRDVDVGYVLRGRLAHRKRFFAVGAGNLNQRRTWALVRAFMGTGVVRYIFMDYGVQKMLYDYARGVGAQHSTLDAMFQYPYGRGAYHGVIRHVDGHRDHFHVRIER